MANCAAPELAAGRPLPYATMTSSSNANGVPATARRSRSNGTAINVPSRAKTMWEDSTKRASVADSISTRGSVAPGGSTATSLRMPSTVSSRPRLPGR
jgi:hypothetical protein